MKTGHLSAALGKYKYQLLLLPALVILCFVPSFARPYTVVLMSSIIMYIVMTISWTIFSAPTGYISLASAAFYGIGIYVSAFLSESLPLPVVMLIGGALSFAVALLVGAITLRLRGVYFTIFTFGLVELLKNIVLWAEIKYSGTRGRFVAPIDHTTVYFCMLATLALILVVAFLIRRSRFGLALKSIGECEDAAMHIGINVTLTKVLGFAISSFAIGAVGAAMATRWNYIDPPIAFDATMSFMPVLMAIFGGIGSIAGPLVGAAVFAYLEETLITQTGVLGSSYMLIFGAFMVIAILFLPNGLAGLVKRRQRRKDRRGEGTHANTAG